MKRKTLKRRHYAGMAGIVIFISIVAIIFSIFFQPSITTQQPVHQAQAAAQTVWQQFDGNPQKSGINDSETLITASSVSSLKQIWQTGVSADSSPVYLSGVVTAQGIKNLIYVTTTDGQLIAFDEATGAKIWDKTTQGNSGPITSSPAIDPNNQYIYSYGKDGKVHKYDVGTGNEETAGGWPVLVTYIPNVEKGSSGLAIGSGYLYVTTSAYPGDQGSYVGHVVAKNLTTGAVSIFNTLCANTKQILNSSCGNSKSGVWSRPGVVMDPGTGNVFFASGNGPYAPPNSLSDSLIELTPDLSKIVDIYTPTNFQQMENDDADLGSTVAVIIPSLEIGVQGSKDNKLRVVNLKNLSGKGSLYNTGGELQTLSVNCNIFSQPISWVSGGTVWVFVTDMCNNLYAYKVVNNNLQQVYEKAEGGSSPLIANGVLFIQSSGSIKAISPTTGSLLWSGQVGNMHWQSPAVIDGHVFVIDNANLTAFAVKSSSVTPQPVTSTTPSGFVCLGNTSCLSPTVTTPVSQSPTQGQTQTSPSTTVPSGTVAISPNPCQTTLGASTKASASGTVKHIRQNGGISKLIQILLTFLIQLLQLLLGGTIGSPIPVQLPSPSPTTVPCASPTP